MINDHFKRLENMYMNAPVNKDVYSGTSISVNEGSAIIMWEISDRFDHALGSLHGSVYFKLLDDAAFFAVQSEVSDVFVLTSSFNINFLRPAVSGMIKAVGSVRFRSRKIFTAEAVLYDSRGREIGLGTGNFLKSSHKLSAEIGYAR